jgi:long-chain fatty acid transport protein
VNDNPTAPDTVSHTLSVGIGLLCKESGRFIGLLTYGSKGGFFGRKALGIDVSHQALPFESRTVTGNPNSTNGTYETTTHAGSMTMQVNI